MFLNKLRSIRKTRGFTLIELLVVISIISILVAVGIVSYRRTNLLSRDSRRKADIQQIRQALETYRSENGVYPDTTWENDIVPDYISEIPTDPKGGSYVYEPGGAPITTYTICAYLELEEGADIYCSVACGPEGEDCNYEVIQP